MPSNTQELARVEGLPPGLVRRCGTRIIEAVAAAVSADQRYAPPRPPDEAQKALLKSMQAEVARCGRDLGIAPETIASKRDLSAVIVDGDRNSRVLTGWRRELIGEDLLRLV